MAYVAILMVTETRADESFAAGQFIVPAIAHGIFRANSCFVWDSTRQENFNFCFSGAFC